MLGCFDEEVLLFDVLMVLLVSECLCELGLFEDVVVWMVCVEVFVVLFEYGVVGGLIDEVV